MSQEFVIQDLVVLIAAQNLNPMMVNPDLLKYSGVIPVDWELVQSPNYGQQAVQIEFTNGVHVISEPNRIMFAEALAKKNVAESVTADLAKRYAKSLPNMDFKAVGFNVRGYIAFDSYEAATQYISQNLLAGGEWQVEGMRASLDLFYPSDRSPLNLTIAEAKLQLQDETKPIVMFSGKFSYKLNADSQEEKLVLLQQSLANLQPDLAFYTNLINTKFLAQRGDEVATSGSLTAPAVV